MIDIVNFKRKSYHIDLVDGTSTIIIPLTNKYFKDVMEDYKTSREGMRAVSYAVNVGHYASPSNLIGLVGDDRKEDIFANLGLPEDFEITDKIKALIAYFNRRYSKGVFGLFKELNRSYEMTRESTEIINASLKLLIRDIKAKQNEPVGDNASSILTQIKEVNTAIGEIRNMTTSLSSDIEALKTMEGILLSEEASNIEMYGGGTLPESAMTDE